MFGLGVGEILIVLAFALIFIGPKKLPELARGLGKSIREFQRAKDDLLQEIEPDFPDDGNENEADITLSGVDYSSESDDSTDLEQEDKENEGDQSEAKAEEEEVIVKVSP